MIQTKRLYCIYILQQCKGKYQRAILYVSGDALRVVDEISKVRQHFGPTLATMLVSKMLHFQQHCREYNDF